MYKIFLILFTLPLLALAQDDVYPSAPRSSPFSDGFYIKNFEPGTVILVNNSPQTGLVRFNGNLFFKESENGKREKLNPYLVKKFFTSRDTFVVAQNITFSYGNLAGRSTSDIEYLKQLKNGKASLFFFLIRSGTGTPGTSVLIPNYYISVKDSKLVFIPWKKKQFIATILPLIKDNEKLAAEIEQGKLKYDDLREIVERYNTEE